MYNPNNLAVYIHWPFCKSKCPYCDFYKEVNQHINQDEIINEYLQALERYYDLTSEREVQSIFFGGGTPSLIKPSNVAKIVDFIARKWHMADKVEISLEANPNSRYATMFADLKNAGVNRLSLGVQALNDDDLRFLGRSHDVKTAKHCLEEVVQTFDNHSADLIYARPEQNIVNWQQELAQICAYNLKHLSLYQLTIEENTVFAKRKIKPLDDDRAAEMYKYTNLFLQDNGYMQYEVSNYALSGCQSRHNLTYWQGGDYIGIGKSAHGRLKIDGQHIATVYPFVHEPLTNKERATELIIMGLRLTEGINIQDFQKICGLDLFNFINKDEFNNLIELKLIIKENNCLRVSAAGMPVLNEIIFRLTP